MSDENKEAMFYIKDNDKRIEKSIKRISELEKNQKEGWENIKKLFYSLLGDTEKSLKKEIAELREAQKEHVILNGQSVNELRLLFVKQDSRISELEKEFKIWKTEDYTEKENAKEIAELREHQRSTDILIREYEQAHNFQLNELKEKINDVYSLHLDSKGMSIPEIDRHNHDIRDELMTLYEIKEHLKTKGWVAVKREDLEFLFYGVEESISPYFHDNYGERFYDLKEEYKIE